MRTSRHIPKPHERPRKRRRVTRVLVPRGVDAIAEGLRASSTSYALSGSLAARRVAPEAEARLGLLYTRIPPHDDRSALRVRGLEAAAIDHQPRVVTALDPADDRSEEMHVAGPAALLVAKAHKIGERLADRDAGRKDRTQPKDAHDVFASYKPSPRMSPRPGSSGFWRMTSAPR